MARTNERNIAGVVRQAQRFLTLANLLPLAAFAFLCIGAVAWLVLLGVHAANASLLSIAKST